MRSQFIGHFSNSKATREELWKTATFVFDANVLLNLYRYSDDARNEFLKVIKKIDDRCWLPEQCAHEFLENRLGVIRGQVEAYDGAIKTLNGIKNTFEGQKGHPFIAAKNLDEMSAIVKKIEKDISKNKTALEKRVNVDSIKEEIADIFDGSVGPKFKDSELDDLFDEGSKRYSEKIPPGYMDSSKHKDPKSKAEKRSNFGDWILWKQVLDMAESDAKSVILVTDDRKEDWWLSAMGKIVGPRPELIAEFCETTEQNILVYTPDKFLEYAQGFLKSKVSTETLDEVKAEQAARIFADTALARKGGVSRPRNLGVINDLGELKPSNFSESGRFGDPKLESLISNLNNFGGSTGPANVDGGINDLRGYEMLENTLASVMGAIQKLEKQYRRAEQSKNLDSDGLIDLESRQDKTGHRTSSVNRQTH